MKKTRLLAGVLSAVLVIAAAWKIGTGDVRATEDDAPESVAINEKNFPDKVFRKYVSDKFDYDKDGSLSVDEITDSVDISLPASGLKDLTGIEYLTNLQFLGCSDNEITKLDLSKNTRLTDLDCSCCKLTKLDLRKCRQLSVLHCTKNQLTELNISGLSELTTIVCWNNEIKTLDVSSCSELTELQCYDNKISKLDLRKCSQLRYLVCDKNDLTSLDLSKAPKLNYLSCVDNKLTELDLTGQKEIEVIACGLNQITSLKLGKKPNLTYLDVSNNKIGKLDISSFENLTDYCCNGCGLTELDVSHNTKLTFLACDENKIAKLDVSNNPELNALHCDENPIGILDISKNTKLDTLSVYNCGLTSIDVSKAPALTNLDCSENPIGTLNVTKNTKLEYLSVYNCGLTSIDVSKCSHLILLSVSSNKIKALDLSKNSDLKFLACGDNELTELDIANLKSLKSVHCYSNKITKISLPKADELEMLELHDNCFSSLDISGCKILIDRLNANGVKEDLEGYFYSEYRDEYGEYTYFTVDMGVTLKGYDLPKANTFKEFVERLYTVALNRSSDPDGKAFWVKKVQNGEYNGADCARYFLLEAPEFMNRGLSVDVFVETLYKTFFDRASDAAGKKGWVDAINSGAMSRADVVNNFIESTEWCNVCATYGVRSGAQSHKSEIASKNATKFATRLYTCCLGREPEEKGLQYWALALTNLDQTGCSAAEFFFTSDEFVGFGLKNDEYVKRLYKTFMDREPEASEVAYWTGEIAKGTQTRASVLSFFGQSEEFTNICAKYGIDRGEI